MAKAKVYISGAKKMKSDIFIIFEDGKKSVQNMRRDEFKRKSKRLNIEIEYCGAEIVRLFLFLANW